MEFAPILIFVVFLVFLSHMFVALFERTKVPDVLYLILIGVVIGPILHVVSPLDLSSGLQSLPHRMSWKSLLIPLRRQNTLFDVGRFSIIHT